MAQAQAKLGILDHFSALEDPRQVWKAVYPLPEILLLILSATIASAEDFVEIEEWGEERRRCDADPEIIAIDGKTSRRTHNQSKRREPLHLVSAWAARRRLVLGQQAIDEKSNEIKAIPLLLDRLILNGALVTIDAMGTQIEIAEKIIEGGGDYCLALKANRPVLHADVERFLADPDADKVCTHTTTDGDHGRIEERRHVVCHDSHHMQPLGTNYQRARKPREHFCSRLEEPEKSQIFGVVV